MWWAQPVLHAESKDKRKAFEQSHTGLSQEIERTLRYTEKVVSTEKHKEINANMESYKGEVARPKREAKI
jgi:hypothetical protein